jgi:hypothetical protein
MTFLDIDGLPERCPAWCHDQHKQALYEGNSPEDSRVHSGGEMAHQLTDVYGYDGKRLDRPGYGSWSVQLRQDEPGTHLALPIVELRCETEPYEDDSRLSTTLRLTTAEARSLGAQLTHLADVEEFHHYG